MIFTGRPNDDPLHVDYVPSIFAYRTNVTVHSTNQKNAHYLRMQQRRQQQIEHSQSEDRAAAEALVLMAETDSGSACDGTTQTPVVSVTSNSTQASKAICKQIGIQACVSFKNQGVQTLSDNLFSAAYLEEMDNDTMLKFYTGLPSWKVFEHVFSILLPHIPKRWSSAKLKPKDEFLLVLMRLRLNLLLEDIAYRFCIARPTVTAIFNMWIDVRNGCAVRVFDQMGP